MFFKTEKQLGKKHRKYQFAAQCRKKIQFYVLKFNKKKINMKERYKHDKQESKLTLLKQKKYVGRKREN